MESYEHVCDVQLSLELGIALHECDVDSLGLGELRFATGLLGNEDRCTVGAELHAPCDEPSELALESLRKLTEAATATVGPLAWGLRVGPTPRCC